MKVESSGALHGDTFKLIINGNEESIPTSKGINLVRINKSSGEIIETTNYNTADDYS